MSALIIPTILMVGAFLAAFLPVLAVIGAVQFTKKRQGGFMHLIPYGIIITSALLIAYAGRDFSMSLDNPMMSKPGLVTWIQRLFTLAMLLVATERLASHILGTRERHMNGLLAFLFVLFWLGATLLPVFLGRYSAGFKHETLYPLLMGMAALTLSASEAKHLVAATRNGLVMFTLASWLMLLVAPHAVIDSAYSQGYLPGVPRFAGLAAHAVALGMLVQIGMFCLWVQPYSKKSHNRFAWGILLLALFLSQAKTAWLSMLVCSVVMYRIRDERGLSQRLFNSRSPMLGSVLIVGLSLAAAAVTIALTIKWNGAGAADFLSSREGAQLASLTGRDVIWAAALDEWRKYPLFGFGQLLFSTEHRMSLGLPSAIHGHNQLIDTLARAGLVGAIPFLLYLAVLGYYAFKYGRQTLGLSAALYTALFMRGISEIPFSMTGYGHEFLGHFLLLGLLAGAHRDSRTSKPADDTSSIQAATPVPRPST